MPTTATNRGSTLFRVASKHDRTIEETIDLANATNRHDRHIDDAELLAWKLNRGMYSARSLSTTRGRASFLRYARDVIAVKGFA